MKGLKFMECLDSREKLSTVYNLYCCLDNLCDNAHINKVDIYSPIYYLDKDSNIRTIKTVTVDINGNVYLKEEFDT